MFYFCPASPLFFARSPLYRLYCLFPKALEDECFAICPDQHSSYTARIPPRESFVASGICFLDLSPFFPTNHQTPNLIRKKL